MTPRSKQRSAGHGREPRRSVAQTDGHGHGGCTRWCRACAEEAVALENCMYVNCGVRFPDPTRCEKNGRAVCVGRDVRTRRRCEPNGEAGRVAECRVLQCCATMGWRSISCFVVCETCAATMGCAQHIAKRCTSARRKQSTNKLHLAFQPTTVPPPRAIDAYPTVKALHTTRGGPRVNQAHEVCVHSGCGNP